MHPTLWLLLPVLLGSLTKLEGSPSPAAAALPRFAERVILTPQSASIFAGARFRFHNSTLAARESHPVSWTLLGLGSLDQDGTYTAPQAARTTSHVLVRSGPNAAAADVRVVPPPRPHSALILTGCYDDGAVDVRYADGNTRAGELDAGDRAGGIAVDAQGGLAAIAVQDRVWALDLRSMRLRASARVPGARFSELTALTSGLFAVTDGNARAGAPGVRLFRILPAARPLAVGQVNAGETPESIIPTRGRRGFIVSNINSDSLMRFRLDSRGRAWPDGMARTGHRPFGIAEDSKYHLLFVALNDNPVVNGERSRPGLQAFDSSSLRRVGNLIVTGGTDALPLGLAVDSRSKRLFVTNEGEADVAVFAIPRMRRIATLSTGPVPWQPAIDESRHRLYVPNAGSNSIDVFDTRTLRRVGLPAPTCGYPTTIVPVQAST